MAVRFSSRRAQVTMIFLIGLLLLFAFLFLMFIRRNLTPDIKTESNVIYELESGLVKEHITSCIVKVTSDALEKLGENGGVIYDYDGGTIPSIDLRAGKDYLDYNSGARQLQVKYGLRENEYCTKIDYAHPSYPYSGLALQSLPPLYAADDECGYGRPSSDYDGVYGEVTLQKLCPANRDSACEIFARGNASGLTMQVQAEDYITSKLGLCVNLTYFSDRFGTQITLQSEAVPRIFVRDEDVQVSVSYPVRIEFKNAEPVSRVFEYQAALPVRLGLLYNFVYSSLSRDARDYSYVLEDQALSSPYYRPGFVFRKIVNPCTACDYPFKNDDIFEAYDSNSIINGRPFLFRAAIQDRRPAIDLIADQVYDLGSSSDFVITQIPVVARDPDDSLLKLVFMSEGHGEGWREGDVVFSFLGLDTTINIPLSNRDIGKHTVGVLAMDAEGYFDYQWFKIEVKDSSANNPQSSDCIDECSSDSYYRFGISDCQNWCFITANYCASECLSAYGMGDSNCESCVWPIFDAERLEAHPSCAAMNFNECQSYPNDCFWITEKDLPYNSFAPRCVDDRELHTVQRFASIVR